MAQTVKGLPAMRETRVRFLGWEDPLEKEMAIHSSTLAWKIPWTEEPDRLQSMGSQRVGHDWATSLSLSFLTIYKTLLSWFFSQTLSPSVPITVFFHPKKLPLSQAYFFFPSQNAIPFLIPSLPKTHFLLPLSNQELIFILAFYRLVSINTNDNS